MATYTFYKYQGAGNDFVIVDNRNLLFDRDNTDLVRRLCDRRFGVGADGLMLLQDVDGYDFEMVYFNADGREGSMCGNGGRCIVAFAKDQGIIGETTDFLAVDGQHRADIDSQQGTVRLQMIDVDAIERHGEAYVLDTGSPHYVALVDGLADFPVVAEGRRVRNSERYRSEGINVNFVEAEGAGYFMRTYERGVEDETLACGTGATAVAIAMAAHEGQDGPLAIPIRVAGGNLTIRFHKNGSRFTDVFLEGPAKFVFKGEITV
ncbi:diaminopimelate epimerase [Parapedobacter sp. 10938]|uniref:diaminopimelate epimerase n=1 Tax=Parapedobacter flavus TaxID=3110225 RepID=UPI002DBC8B19|nr:diaminopimelate epimerase [Parapedobacter sp. 10938]MEC3879507.1 diaminopimelate epimerase [Parapedobacter sp. 10938]